MKTFVIIPTFNEKENVIRLIPEIFKLMPGIFVLVVDDNSPDGTADAVKNLQKQFPNLRLLQRAKKEGLGRAYINAFEELLKDPEIKYVIMMDADLSHSPEYLPRMIQEGKNYGLVIGSRYVKSGATIGWELWRKILSAGGNFYCRLITRMPIHDCTGGFNVINTDLLRKVDFSQIDVSGYAFIMEIKYFLCKAGAALKEVPIIFKNRVGGESKISGHIISEGILAPWKMIFKKKFLKNPVCLACKKADAQFLTRKHSYDLYRCGNCRSIFIWPLPKDFLRLYSEDYFTGAKAGFGYVNYDLDKSVSEKTLKTYLDEIEKILPQKGKLLDIGAATGYFLELARQRDWQTIGLEISNYAANIARQKSLDVKTGILEDAAFNSETFDAITLLDVLEHMPDPQLNLRLSYKFLKKGGVLAINTPDADSLTARILGKNWHLLVPPEHLIIFGRRQLIKILEEIGFRIFVVDKIGKKYTFQYVFQILSMGRKFPVWKWLAKITKNNFLGRLAVSVNARDNVFIIAQKP